MAHKTIDRRQAYAYLKQLESSGKTPVSVAMELATKLGAVADFKEDSDLKWSNSSFKYIAKLGDIQAVGVGSSKKEAKQNSAKELLKLIKSESENLGPSSSPNYARQNNSYSSFSSPVSPLSSSMSDLPGDRNVIGELQNLAAKRRWELPKYEFDEPTGEAHSKTFTCLVKMMSGLQCRGVGSSKKAAKKEAADKMLSILQEEGECYDAVDAPQTSIFRSSPYANNNSSPETINDSDLEGYNSSGSDSSLPPRKLDLSTEITDDLNYDDLSEQKLESCKAKNGFKVEYIPLPNKSLKGQNQVFVKLTFNGLSNKQNHPIVTHGSGETPKIARGRAAERALKHLELMLSV